MNGCGRIVHRHRQQVVWVNPTLKTAPEPGAGKSFPEDSRDHARFEFAAFLPDGENILFVGNRPGGRRAFYPGISWWWHTARQDG